MITIGIGIPHYGDISILNKLFESLMIDNIGDEHWFERSNIRYVVRVNNDVNGEGFTKSCNKLITKLMKDGCDWIWLLNNDTHIYKNTFNAISSILPKYSSDIGIVGFQIRLSSKPDIIQHGGTIRCYPNGVHKSGSVKLNDLNKRTYERWVTFSSVLIRKEVIEAIGLLDPNMSMIYSDSDYCYRARAYGYKVIYEPQFVIYHDVGISAKEPQGKMKNIFLSDLLYFQNKWLNGKLFYDLDKEIIDGICNI